MPESLVTEIFGENAKYADSINTTVTPNPNTPEFPFTVQFDSSKILSKPKRELGTMAGIGMPSNKYIDIQLEFTAINDSGSYSAEYTAPANGYINVGGSINPINASVGLAAFTIKIYENDTMIMVMNFGNSYSGQLYAISMLPCRKGQKIEIIYAGSKIYLSQERFIYAEGEI